MFLVDTKPDKAPTWVPGRCPSRPSGSGPPAGSPQRPTVNKLNDNNPSSSSVPRSGVSELGGSAAAVAAATSPCPVCFDNVPTSHLMTLEACGHGYCYTCLREYCIVQVGEGAARLPCPASVGGCDGCAGTISDRELFLLLPPATFQRYKRFAALADNRNLRECPQCGLLQEPDSASFPDIVCGSGLAYHGAGVAAPSARSTSPHYPPRECETSPDGSSDGSSYAVSPDHARVTPPRCVLDLDFSGMTVDGCGPWSTPRGRHRRRGGSPSSRDRDPRSGQGIRQSAPYSGAGSLGLRRNVPHSPPRDHRPAPPSWALGTTPSLGSPSTPAWQSAASSTPAPPWSPVPLASASGLRPPTARWEGSDGEDDVDSLYSDTHRLLDADQPPMCQDEQAALLCFGAGSGGTLDTGDAAEPFYFGALHTAGVSGAGVGAGAGSCAIPLPAAVPPTVPSNRGCGTTFCFYHSNAHTGETCAAYNARVGGDPDYVASLRAIRGASKPCPHCGMDIQLQGGCDHVRCPSCHLDWCWRCGGKQMTGTMMRSCANCKQMYLDHRYFRTICVLLVLLSPLVLALTLMWMALSPLLLLLAVAALRPRMTWKRCGLVIAYPVVVMLVIGGCIPDDPLDDSNEHREEVDPFDQVL